MKRAAVLIGVRKAHNLPELKAVFDSVYAMKSWALSQGFDPKLVTTITDRTSKVTPQRIKATIKKLVERDDLDQLIIYFSGHGVNLNYSEYWLLSDAVYDSDAAVNVKGSEERARYSVIPHVVFLSDTCRTAPLGIQAQGISGCIIFPNKPVPGPEKSVDLFYATLLGEPALEIADSNVASAGYRAIYTDTLLEALYGIHAEIVDRQNQDAPGFVRPRPLKKFLAKDLPNRVFRATHGQISRCQQPDARITSDDDAWLSEVKTPVLALDTLFKNGQSIIGRTQDNGEQLLSEITSSKDLLQALISDDHLDMEEALHFFSKIRTLSRPTTPTDIDIYLNQISNSARPFYPLQLDSPCGFKIIGAEVSKCLAYNCRFKISNSGHIVEAFLLSGKAVSTLLKFKNGRATLLPVIKDYLTTLTFDGNSLIDVSFEATQSSIKWNDYNKRATDTRKLHAVVASSLRFGISCFKKHEIELLTRHMQIADNIDLSLALYASHIYRDTGKRHLINQVIDLISHNLGIGLFDILLLAGRLNDELDSRPRFIFPFLPMLSQNWALIPAHEVSLPSGLQNISRHVLTDSLWTLFDEDGAHQIAKTIQKGKTI